MRIIAVAVVILTSIGSTTFAQVKPFPSPDIFAEEVANLVVEKSTRQGGLSSRSFVQEKFLGGDDQRWYQIRVFSRFGEVYEVHYRIDAKGVRTLGIDYYLTSLRFDTANDLAFDELILGRPKIYQELHMTDYGVDGILDAYQMYNKKSHSVWSGFTREERNSGERAGVQEFLYMNGKILQKRKFWRDRWIEVSPEKRDEINSDYEDHLFEVLINIRLNRLNR